MIKLLTSRWLCSMHSKPEIILIEPPAVSKFGNQRIFGGNGSNKSDFRKPPLDLMMISGYLRKEGFDNILLDFNASRKTTDDVEEAIRRASGELVFFSTSTCTIGICLPMCVLLSWTCCIRWRMVRCRWMGCWRTIPKAPSS